MSSSNGTRHGGSEAFMVSLSNHEGVALLPALRGFMVRQAHHEAYLLFSG
jgi:hypothetical protein